MTIPLTPPEQTTVVVPAPAPGEGNWSGAASATRWDGQYWLTWRERRPLDAGRGVAAHVAVSADGIHFEREGSVTVDDFPPGPAAGLAGTSRPGAAARRAPAAVSVMCHQGFQALVDRGAHR